MALVFVGGELGALEAPSNTCLCFWILLVSGKIALGRLREKSSLPALCRLRPERYDPHRIPPLLFSNLLIYKTNTLSACQGAMARFARP